MVWAVPTPMSGWHTSPSPVGPTGAHRGQPADGGLWCRCALPPPVTAAGAHGIIGEVCGPRPPCAWCGWRRAGAPMPYTRVVCVASAVAVSAPPYSMWVHSPAVLCHQVCGGSACRHRRGVGCWCRGGHTMACGAPTHTRPPPGAEPHRAHQAGIGGRARPQRCWRVGCARMQCRTTKHRWSRLHHQKLEWCWHAAVRRGGGTRRHSPRPHVPHHRAACRQHPSGGGGGGVGDSLRPASVCAGCVACHMVVGCRGPALSSSNWRE